MIHAFGDCELDTERFELRRNGERHHVEPQVFDVLVYLVEHRDRVVPREELLAQVWGHSYVSEATLSSRLMAARKAIGDNGRAQALIRTVRGRGYQFVGEAKRDRTLPPAQPPPARPLVGRDRELGGLREALEAALAGERRTVFVTGEAGVGKTTLVEAFLAETRDDAAPLVARGFCLEHRGTGEPYMPVLEALGRLCGERAGAPLLEALRARAPTWLIQLPWLLSKDELQDMQRAAFGASPERMLRELAEALEVLTSGTPLLVLVLEDLHWSDDSTLDLVSRLARREEPARLLLVCTYRQGEGTVAGLQRELRVRGRCLELPLPFLSGEAVRLQLETRLPGGALPSALAGLVHRRTDGNPLFVGCLVDSWLHRGTLEQTEEGWELREEPTRLAEGIPDSLRDLIDQDCSRLGADDLGALEAASVVGTAFVAAAVPAPDVEARCSRLAREGRLVRTLEDVEWGGEISTRFAFIHDLHRELLYERIPAGRRAELHREVADRLQEGYAAEAPARASEIALHCVRGHDASRALQYLPLAAEQALRRSGHREAILHLGEALQQLKSAQGVDEPERIELSLQAALGPSLLLTQGFSSPRAELALRRALELSERLGDERRLAGSLYALATLMEYRGDYSASEELLARSLALKPPRRDPSADLEAHELMACSLFHQGHFSRAIEHAKRGLALYEPKRFHQGPAAFGEDPAVSCSDWAGLALGCLGLFDEAEERINAAVAMAESPGRVYGLANALTHAARLHQLQGEPQAVERRARRAVALAADQGFAYQTAVARMLLGWALAVRGEQDGLELLREGLDGHRAIGAEMDRPYFLALLAEASIAAGGLEAARSALTEALGSTGTGRPFFYEPEVHRLRGELELRSGAGLEVAERHYRMGLEVARRQGARSLELRAAFNLARALQAAGRDAEAAETLAALGDWFLAEDGSADLRKARRLLQELST